MSKQQNTQEFDHLRSEGIGCLFQCIGIALVILAWGFIEWLAKR